MTRLHGIRFLVAGLAALVAFGAAVPAQAERSERFVARGELKASGDLLITFEEWNLFTCPEIPQTQGLTSYFIPLPARFAHPGMRVEVTGGNLSPSSPFQLNFWSKQCRPILASVNEPTLVPKGTVFVEVWQHFEAVTEFELVVEPYEAPR